MAETSGSCATVSQERIIQKYSNPQYTMYWDNDIYDKPILSFQNEYKSDNQDKNITFYV